MNKMIFEPIEINGMKLKNRIGLAPLLNMPDVWTTFSITDATIEWFEARARGGAGLVMTGSFIPMMVNAPGFKERFAKLAEVIHAHGAKLGVQITGEGSVMTGTGPSTPPYPDDRDPKQSIFEIITFKTEVELPIPPEPVAFTVEETRLHIQNLCFLSRELLANVATDRPLVLGLVAAQTRLSPTTLFTGAALRRF